MSFNRFSNYHFLKSTTICCIWLYVLLNTARHHFLYHYFNKLNVNLDVFTYHLLKYVDLFTSLYLKWYFDCDYLSIYTIGLLPLISFCWAACRVEDAFCAKFCIAFGIWHFQFDFSERTSWSYVVATWISCLTLHIVVPLKVRSRSSVQGSHRCLFLFCYKQHIHIEYQSSYKEAYTNNRARTFVF